MKRQMKMDDMMGGLTGRKGPKFSASDDDENPNLYVGADGNVKARRKKKKTGDDDKKDPFENFGENIKVETKTYKMEKDDTLKFEKVSS